MEIKESVSVEREGGCVIDLSNFREGRLGMDNVEESEKGEIGALLEVIATGVDGVVGDDGFPGRAIAGHLCRDEFHP